MSVVGGVRASPADVVGDRPVEDEGLLQHRRDVAAQVGQAQPADVAAVEGDPALVGVVEAEQQLGQRRLARPARPDHGDLLARGDAQVDSGQRGPLGVGVGERDALQRERALRAGERRRIDGVDDGGLLVEHLDDPLGPGLGRRHLVPQAAEPGDRAVELAEVGDEDEEAAEGDPAVGQLVDGETHHSEDADELDEVAERPEQRLQADGDHLGGEGALVLPAVAGGLVVLAVVGLDEREVARGSPRRRRRWSPTVGAARGRTPGCARQHARDGQEPGCGDEGREREPPVEVEQHPGKKMTWKA